MRQMFDALNANALPDNSGTLVALYPDHPWATNPGRIFTNAKVVKITVKRGGSAKGYQVADIENGDFTPESFAAEVVMAHAAGNDVFSGYWNDASDAAVRAALLAAGVSNFDFATRRWRAAWDDVQPSSLPNCVAWQWADGTMRNLPYDTSAVADSWPAVDTPWVVPSPAPAPSATYTVYVSMPGYVNAADAEAERGSNSTVPPGTYNVQREYNGMYALFQHNGAPGWWVNPAQNSNPTPAPAPPAPHPPAPGHTVITVLVKKGESFDGIGEAHGMTQADMISLNPRAGHPPGNYADVWPGDSLRVWG
jgi:hypothetical protein